MLVFRVPLKDLCFSGMAGGSNGVRANYLWIGLDDTKSEGKFVWNTEEVLDYSKRSDKYTYYSNWQEGKQMYRKQDLFCLSSFLRFYL